MVFLLSLSFCLRCKYSESVWISQGEIPICKWVLPICFYKFYFDNQLNPKIRFYFDMGKDRALVAKNVSVQRYADEGGEIHT